MPVGKKSESDHSSPCPCSLVGLVLTYHQNGSQQWDQEDGRQRPFFFVHSSGYDSILSCTRLGISLIIHQSQPRLTQQNSTFPGEHGLYPFTCLVYPQQEAEDGLLILEATESRGLQKLMDDYVSAVSSGGFHRVWSQTPQWVRAQWPRMTVLRDHTETGTSKSLLEVRSLSRAGKNVFVRTQSWLEVKALQPQSPGW